MSFADDCKLAIQHGNEPKPKRFVNGLDVDKVNKVFNEVCIKNSTRVTLDRVYKNPDYRYLLYKT